MTAPALNFGFIGSEIVAVSLPGTSMAQALFSHCVAHGGRAWNHSAMVRALEGMASFGIGQS